MIITVKTNTAEIWIKIQACPFNIMHCGPGDSYPCQQYPVGYWCQWTTVGHHWFRQWLANEQDLNQYWLIVNWTRMNKCLRYKTTHFKVSSVKCRPFCWGTPALMVPRCRQCHMTSIMRTRMSESIKVQSSYNVKETLLFNNSSCKLMMTRPSLKWGAIWACRPRDIALRNTVQG